MSGSRHKQHITHQHTLVYFPEDHSEYNSKNLLTVSIRLMGLMKKAVPSPASVLIRHKPFPMLVESTALNSFMKEVIRQIFQDSVLGKLFELGALPVLCPLMATRTSKGLVNFCSHAGPYSCVHIHV